MTTNESHNLAVVFTLRGRGGLTVNLQAVVDEGIVFVILEDVDPDNPPVPTVGKPVLSWAGGPVAHHRVYAGDEGCIGFEPWEGPWPGKWSPAEEATVCRAAAVSLGLVKVVPMGIGGDA